MPHPATLNILKTEPGQPIATWSQTATHPEPLPRISIAHSAQHAIAIASEQPCGIDLEEFGAAASVPEYFLNPTERQLLRDPAEPDLETAAWCVKEAVAKKVGTGLQGRPADFEIIERNGANWLVRYRIDQSLHPVVVHRWKDSYWIARSNLITV